MHRTLAALGLCLLTAGCDFVTDPDPLEEFAYQQLDPATEFEENIDAAGFFGEILAVGQFEAPSGCYELKGDLDRSGTTLDLKITAQVRSGGGNCTAVVTGYRWSAAIRNIGAATYDLRVTHQFRNNERPATVHTARVNVR